MKNEENFERNYEPTPPKKKSKLWIIIVIICVLILGIGTLIAYLLTDGFDFSSSSSRNDNESSENKKDNDKEKDKDDEKDKEKEDEKEEEKKEQILNVEEFIEERNGNIIVKSINRTDYSKKTYLFDKNLNFISEIKDYNKYSWKDGYTLVKDYQSKTSYVLNYKGEKVWEDNNATYKNVELASNGHLLLSKQIDTFNSSETQSGIYDLNTKKMVLDFNTKYNQLEFGNIDQDIIYLEYKKTFFDTKSNKLITFKDECNGNFIDGYSTIVDYDNDYNDYLAICSNKGSRKTVAMPDNIYIQCDKHANGICFHHEGFQESTGSKWTWYSFIIDLENAKIKELGTDYTHKINKVLFNKNGYALLIFENSGNVKYYTVIDKEGKRMFEPIRVNDVSTKLVIDERNEISDNNHYIITDDGKTLVVNHKNEVVVEPEDGETFKKLIGNYIVVSNKDKNLYLKDLKGKKVNIKIEK